MRRVGLLLGAILCLASILLASAAPAAAHGAGGVEATNFETTIDGVTPPLAGVRVRLIETGSRLELRNDGPDVVVLGRQGEPYLRVGPEGAFENRRSPSVAGNRQESHQPPPAPPAGPAGSLGGEPPDWRRVSDRPVVRWHDHVTHWNELRDPPEVERDRTTHHVVIPRWEVALQRGDERAVVFGHLTWAPGPSPAPWFGLMAAACVAVGALGLLRRWGRPLAAATAVLVVVDVVHAFAVAFASSGGVGSQLARVVTGSFYGIIGWALAAVAIRLLRRSKVDGLYAAVFAGLSIAVFGGLLDLATLSRRFSPFALPLGVARLCVAVAAGAGVGLAVACLLVIRRTPDARRVVGDPDGEISDEAPAGDRPAVGVGGRSEPPS